MVQSTEYLATGTNNYTAASSGFDFDSDNGKLLIDMNAAGATVNVLEKDRNS